jgi:hypothetical protein
MQIEKKACIASLAIILALSAIPGRCADNLAQQEVELLTEFRNTRSSEALLHLALLRERRGKDEEARATWALAKQLWGPKQMPKHSSAPTRSWGEAANFFVHRLQRKINLRKSVPPQGQQQQLRHQLAEAAMSFADSPSVDQLDLAVQADLDGDMIDEIFYIGKSGPLGKRTKKTMGIARWNGKAYQVVWRTTTAIPFMVHVTDEDGDRWKEIFCGYEPDTDNAATLYFNGQTAMFL